MSKSTFVFSRADVIRSLRQADQPCSLREANRRHIILALLWSGGNRAQAARTLGVTRKGLYLMIRRHGLKAQRRKRRRGSK